MSKMGNVDRVAEVMGRLISGYRSTLVGLGLALTLSACSKDKSNDSVSAVQTALAAQTPSQADVVATNRVEGEAFLVEWKPGDGASGANATGQLVLTPKAPFKCNLEYPYKLKLTAPTVTVSKSEVTKPEISVDVKKVVVPVGYTMPDSPRAIDGLFAFSVCTDDKCLIERVQLKMTTQAP
jgi:hypothetical protein